MKREVECAAQFLTGLVRRGAYCQLQADLFYKRLCELLTKRYQNHWHPEKPVRGSAYRCIRNDRRLDPLISEAAAAAQLSEVAQRLLPCEFTLWVDPEDVSYRIGEDGSICALDLAVSDEPPRSDDLGKRHDNNVISSSTRRFSPSAYTAKMEHADNRWTYSRPTYRTSNTSFVFGPSKPRAYYRPKPAYAPMHILNAPLVSSVAS